MESISNKKVLVSGASIAGLTTAWWMNSLGYQITVVEPASQPRIVGAAINISGDAVDVIRRMGIFEQLKLNRLNVEAIVFKNADDSTAGTISMPTDMAELTDDDLEIERDIFIGLLHNQLKNDVEFIFNDRITTLTETATEIQATFINNQPKPFHLVLGCDGSHSGVRKIWFGHEEEYSYFLEAYFSISIVNQLLVKQKTMQMYNMPYKAVMLNAYKHKTDIIFCFYSEKEIPYNYRDVLQQKEIIMQQFEGQSWRTGELLEEIKHSDNFYFDKFCQIKMPSWTKGRVALVGDAGYCASPAAGMGASLAIAGAAALADSLKNHNGDFELAFAEYNQHLRPFIETVQATAEQNVKEHFILRTEEAIRERNQKQTLF